MITNDQDRAALKRIIQTVIAIEEAHREELQGILKDESKTMEERAEAYLDLICLLLLHRIRRRHPHFG